MAQENRLFNSQHHVATPYNKTKSLFSSRWQLQYDEKNVERSRSQCP